MQVYGIDLSKEKFDVSFIDAKGKEKKQYNICSYWLDLFFIKRMARSVNIYDFNIDIYNVI